MTSIEMNPMRSSGGEIECLWTLPSSVCMSFHDKLRNLLAASFMTRLAANLRPFEPFPSTLHEDEFIVSSTTSATTDMPNAKWLIIPFVSGHLRTKLYGNTAFWWMKRFLNLVTGLWTHALVVFSVIRIINVSIAPIIVSSVEMPRLQSSFSLTGLWIVKAAPLWAILHSKSARWSIIEWILNAGVVKWRKG